MIYNFLAFLILAGAGAFLIWFGRLWSKVGNLQQEVDQSLDAQGIDTEAEIVNHRVSVGRRGASYYYITYQYSAKGTDGQPQKLTNEDAVSSADYHRLNLGDHITVRYLPDKPQTVRPGSGIHKTFTATSFHLGGTLSMGLGVALVIAGVILFIGFTINDNTKAATATAETLRLSATPDESQKPATLAAGTATAQADQNIAGKVRDGIASRLADWKKVDDKVMHRVLPPETDLGLDEVEIDYGHCAQGSFYLYVWLEITNRMSFQNETDSFMDGYGYVEGSTPPNCYPTELSQVWLRNGGSLGNNWYAVSGAIDVKTGN